MDLSFTPWVILFLILVGEAMCTLATNLVSQIYNSFFKDRNIPTTQFEWDDVFNAAYSHPGYFMTHAPESIHNFALDMVHVACKIDIADFSSEDDALLSYMTDFLECHNGRFVPPNKNFFLTYNEYRMHCRAMMKMDRKLKWGKNSLFVLESRFSILCNLSHNQEFAINEWIAFIANTPMGWRFQNRDASFSVACIENIIIDMRRMLDEKNAGSKET